MEDEELQFKNVDVKDTDPALKIERMIEEAKKKRLLSVEKSIEVLKSDNILTMDKNEFVELLLSTNYEYIKIMILRDIALSLRKGLQIEKETQ
jgi:hypothetical protein